MKFIILIIKIILVLKMMMEVGNSRARAAYEANLPDNYRRPQANG